MEFYGYYKSNKEQISLTNIDFYTVYYSLINFMQRKNYYD